LYPLYMAVLIQTDDISNIFYSSKILSNQLNSLSMIDVEPMI
jgi:hypothetical protein